LRELYFTSALRDADQNVFFSKLADYRTKDTIFEIGGKNKTFAQVAGAKLPAFVVKDDILTPSQKVIPLFYFGFLY
jgi:hypothetical protein